MLRINYTNALFVSTLAAAIAVTAFAQSNIDNTVPDKHGWGENVGWTNWRDANAGVQGAQAGAFVMSGFLWGENIGWINLGDGTPASPPFYANVNDTDVGVNIASNGMLTGYAWGENVGWINFAGGAMATPAQPARILCATPPVQPLARLTGYAWGENTGWINLSELTATKFVALTAAATPMPCDLNEDGDDNGLDIQLFVKLLLAQSTPSWRNICQGDVEAIRDNTIDAGDVTPFVDCILSKP